MREIEKKYIAVGYRMYHIIREIEDLLKDEITGTTKGSGKDYFFESSKADVVRVRNYDDLPGGQLTVKKNDKGGIVDRLEINVALNDQQAVDDSLQLMRALHGTEVAAVWKTYKILWLDRINTNISIYKTDIAMDECVIIEVEGPDVFTINGVITKIKKIISMDIVNKSLYEMSLEKE